MARNTDGKRNRQYVAPDLLRRLDNCNCWKIKATITTFYVKYNYTIFPVVFINKNDDINLNNKKYINKNID